MKRFFPTCILIVALVCISCQKKTKTSDTNLGRLQHNFPVSEGASPDFEKGLLLLHSFEYDDAREAFLEAQDKDATEMMAYWGEAMSYYKALWGLQDVAAGRKALNRMGDTKEKRLAKAREGIERDFWQAVEILYGEGELYERNQRYADHMAELYSRYPGNQEVAAFYALGLMWSVQGRRDSDVFERSAKVAAGILEENPDHPGALHYTIHAYDDPAYAELATLAANKYAKVAPDATHALHMPSHIYLALGMWNDVVASNEVSYAASISRMERKELDDDARGYHSYAWLHYGYLQQGRFVKAAEQLADMITYTERSPSKGARSYLITMQNAQRVESGVWPDMEPIVVDDEDLGIDAKARQRFFWSMKGYDAGNAEIIETQIDSLQIDLAAAELLVTGEGIALCSAGPSRYAPSKTSVNRTKVIVQEMKALKALVQNDSVAAEKAMKLAVSLEMESEYSYGPPDIPFPSFELYGDWLVENARYEEAITQYDQSLAKAPKRAKALNGKIIAYTHLGNMDKVEELTDILDEFQNQEQYITSN